MKYLSILLFGSYLAFAQPKASTAESLIMGMNEKSEMTEISMFKNLPLTCIGPSVMSGRVVDIEVNDNDPTMFYVAYASGGLWYTQDNGISFEPVLDGSGTQNIGDIAIDWTSETIWVGTGENNSSRSSYSGIGVLKSTDKGKTWKNMGLFDSHHIGRILINPNNTDEVVIGVTGHLYSKNTERGVFKTKDGGKTWQKTLYINEETGIIDIAVAPFNFDLQFAAAWQKDRKAWNFMGYGEGSGIYKSTDGGDTWKLVSTAESGFPVGDGVGRIGLAAFDENTVYAVLDNQNRRTVTVKKDLDPKKLSKDDFKSMEVETFLALNNDTLNNFLKSNNFQEKYRAENVKNMVRDGVVKPNDLAVYLEDSNASLFDTPVIGAEVYRSDDSGETWQKMNESYIDDLFYSYGYYFAQVRVDHNNKDKIYLAGVPLVTSDDGGKTFTSISKENVHSDHHALWINPKRPGHLINGNDGGINITYNDGKVWSKNNSPKVGQYYAINVDRQEPYNVYGGLQDNGVWKGPHNASDDNRWLATGQNPWKSIMGGDGMQVQIDNRNPNIVYTGFQFGNYYRLNLEQGENKRIQPKHQLGEAPYRFNWQTPILLSEHNQDILYFGGNKLHRSLNQGETWETISKDLTTGGKKGNVAYGTLTTISESPFAFGLLYVGSDDGLVHVSKDGGASWKNITSGLPSDLWVSEVKASKHKKERVYITLNGYRWDDFTPYIFRSDDFGATWTGLGEDIPLSPINAFVEDPVNENLIFVGTDNGLYVSLDRGKSWQSLQNGMPNVAVHDLVIQPIAKHLLVGTHGRSIYKVDISTLQQMTFDMGSKDLVVFQPADLKHSQRWGNSWSSWRKPNTPGLDINFYLKNPNKIEVSITNGTGIEVSTTSMSGDAGLNILSYDVTFSNEGLKAFQRKNKKVLNPAQNGKTYLPKGTYTITLKSQGKTQQKEFEIK